MSNGIAQLKQYAKKAWRFFWLDESIWSWLLNIVVAFIVIKFIVYPLLGFAFGTSFPLVAVVSESMEHGLHNQVICGQEFSEYPESFDTYWNTCGKWYEEYGITKEQFKDFPLRNGFDKGDVIILWRANSNNIEVGDVVVFQGAKPQPIIHRAVKVWQEDGTTFYQTKGDHNSNSLPGFMGETKIDEKRIYGQGVLRIPYLGWVKIVVVEAAGLVGVRVN